MPRAEYLVIVEKYGAHAFGAYVPELPGIGVAGESEDEIRELVADAIRLYLDEIEKGSGRSETPVAVNHYTVAV